MRWRAVTAPVTGPGTVVLRGLAPLVIAQVLLGLQRRVGDGLKLREQTLRQYAAELRLRQVATLEDCGGPGEGSPSLRPLAASLAGYARIALLDPETERDKDVWDLAAFGHNGQAGFTAISQGWLRQCAKDWALDDLTRRRGRKAGTHLRQRIALIAALSASLRTRPDHGEQRRRSRPRRHRRVPAPACLRRERRPDLPADPYRADRAPEADPAADADGGGDPARPRRGRPWRRLRAGDPGRARAARAR